MELGRTWKVKELLKILASQILQYHGNKEQIENYTIQAIYYDTRQIKVSF